MALLDELAAREAAMRWLDERTRLGTQPVEQPDVANFPFQGLRAALDTDTRSLNDVAVRLLIDAGTRARLLV